MPKTDRPGDERSRVFVDCSPAQLAPGGFEDEAGGEREPLRDRLDVGAPLVAVRGVGVESVPSRGAPYRDRIPPRRLEEDILRRAGRNRRLDAADDSRERESPFFVGDDDIFGMKLPLDTIEAEEPLPFSRVADDQVAPRNFVRVEGMERLADSPQSDVRRVHPRIDRFQSEILHPPDPALR